MGRITLILFIITSISSVLSESEDEPEKGLSSFYKYDIVPTIIPDAPAYLLTVTFANNVKVLQGNVLKLTKIVFEPTIASEDVDPTSNYTLIEIDPDTPSRGKNSQTLLHWMIVNIPGSNLKGGHTVAKFLNSTPPPGSGYHRYIFLLYAQNTYIQVNEVLQQTINRINFSPQTFAYDNNLGELVAGNFYQAGTAPGVTPIKLLF